MKKVRNNVTAINNKGSLDEKIIYEAGKNNPDDIICLMAPDFSIECFDNNIELKNTCIVDLSRNRLTTLHGLWNIMPQAWWIDVSKNSINDFGPPSMIPKCIGKLELYGNSGITSDAISKLCTTHILRLGLKYIPNMLFKSHEECINYATRSLPLTWVINEEFIYVDSNDNNNKGSSDIGGGDFGIHINVNGIGGPSSFTGTPSLSGFLSPTRSLIMDEVGDDVLSVHSTQSTPQVMISYRNEETKLAKNNELWLDFSKNERESILLRVIQKFPTDRRMREFIKLDILLEDYLEESRIFNRTVLANKSPAFNQIKKPVINPTKFLKLDHSTRLDTAVLLSSTLMFKLPRQLYEESFSVLLGETFSLSEIKACLDLPPFVRTALVAIMKRITLREMSELDYLGQILPKLHTEWNISGPEGLPAPLFDTAHGFNHLFPIRKYLDRPMNAPNEKEKEMQLKMAGHKSFKHFSALENEIIAALPDVVTGNTINAVGIGNEMSFLARHATLLLARAPACPTLTQPQTSYQSQKFYDEMQPLLKVASMRYADLELVFTGPKKDGRAKGRGKDKGSYLGFGQGLPKSGKLNLTWNTEGREAPPVHYARPWRVQKDQPSLMEDSEEGGEFVDSNHLSASNQGRDESPLRGNSRGVEKGIDSIIGGIEAERVQAFTSYNDNVNAGTEENLALGNIQDLAAPPFVPSPVITPGPDQKHIGYNRIITAPTSAIPVTGFSDDQDWKSSYILAPTDAIVSQNKYFQENGWDNNGFMGWEEIEQAPVMLTPNEMGATDQAYIMGLSQRQMKKQIQTMTRSLTTPNLTKSSNNNSSSSSNGTTLPPSQVLQSNDSSKNDSNMRKSESALDLMMEMGSMRAFRGPRMLAQAVTMKLKEEVVTSKEKGKQIPQRLSDMGITKEKGNRNSSNSSIDFGAPLGIPINLPSKFSWRSFELSKEDTEEIKNRNSSDNYKSPQDTLFLTATNYEEEVGNEESTDLITDSINPSQTTPQSSSRDATMNDDLTIDIADLHRQESIDILNNSNMPQSYYANTLDVVIPLDASIGTRFLQGSQGVESNVRSVGGRNIGSSWYPCYEKPVYHVGAVNLNSLRIQRMNTIIGMNNHNNNTNNSDGNLNLNNNNNNNINTNFTAKEMLQKITQNAVVAEKNGAKGIDSKLFRGRGLPSIKTQKKNLNRGLPLLFQPKTDTVEVKTLNRYRNFHQNQDDPEKIKDGYVKNKDLDPWRRRRKSIVLPIKAATFSIREPQTNRPSSTKIAFDGDGDSIQDSIHDR